MKWLLLDYKNISKVIKLPVKCFTTDSKSDPIIVVQLTEKDYNTLQNTPKGKDRVEKFKSFVYKSLVLIQYSKKNKICDLGLWAKSISVLKKILELLKQNFPQDVVIKISLRMKSPTKNIISLGFKNPSICPKFCFGGKVLCMYKYNKKSSKVSISSVTKEIEYVKNQKSEKYCSMLLRFTDDSVKFLRGLVDIERSCDSSGKCSQKEQSGRIFVGESKKDRGRIVFDLHVDNSSLLEGVEEEVDVVSSRYNFHTHPREAYVRHSVTNGWPSSTDYVGFYRLRKETIIHFVITLEGIYVLTFSPKWYKNLNDVSQSYISRKYNIDHKEPLKITDYVNKINNMDYKGKGPVFIISFLSWDECGEVFHVFFPKTGNNCVMRDY